MLGTEEKFLLKAPLCVSIITTNRCNLRCKHCINSAMSEKNDDYLSTSDIKSIIKQCKEIKTVITGGSMSGKLTDCLRDLVVSKKRIRTFDYQGPYSVKLWNVTISAKKI